MASIVIGGGASRPALADVDAQTRALNEILDAADGICAASPVEEHDQRVELTESAKAKLGSTVKEVADLGIEGANEYQSDSATGSLQQDLATALANSSNCKLTVLTILQAKMIIR